jgi:putative membrane protein
MIPLPRDDKRAVIVWLLIFFSALLWSAIKPRDYFTWFLEVSPALAAVVVLALTYK